MLQAASLGVLETSFLKYSFVNFILKGDSNTEGKFSLSSAENTFKKYTNFFQCVGLNHKYAVIQEMAFCIFKEKV